MFICKPWRTNYLGWGRKRADFLLSDLTRNYLVSVRRGFLFLLRNIAQVYTAIKGANFHILSLDSLSFIMSFVYISESIGLASMAVQADLRLILSEIDSELSNRGFQ